MRNRIGSSQQSHAVIVPPRLRRYLVAAALASTLCATPHSASADDDMKRRVHASDLAKALAVWENVDGTFRLAKNEGLSSTELCERSLAGLTEINAPESVMFELKKDIPDLKAGTYPWTAARAACAHLIAEAKHDTGLVHAVFGIDSCYEEMTKKGGPDDPYPFNLGRHEYNEAVKVGLPVTEVITSRGGTDTLQALYDKWCVGGRAKLEGAEEKRMAPFKKLLKADKLTMALRDFDYIMLPGNAKVTLERLAAMNVWFQDASPSKVCSNGLQVHVLHRYQFNAQHKLVKVTDREFCGRPPGSALR